MSIRHCLFAAIVLFPGLTLDAQPVNSSQLAVANNQLAISLFQRLNKEGQSVFFSPYSIYTALHMTSEGASGKTLQEMQEVLASRGKVDSIRNDIRKSQYRYNNLLSSGDSIQTANALWLQKGFPVNAIFSSKVENDYQAKVQQVDFLRAPDRSRLTINNWVSEQTHHRINDLLPKPAVTTETKLVLVNTIWFKGKWQNPFDARATSKELFHAPDADVPVSFMHKQTTVNYTEDETLQIVELPYASKKLSMLVLLPAPGKAAKLDQLLTPVALNSWLSKMKPQETNLTIPKFHLEGKFSLAESLKAMGMPSAFSSTADFSNIALRALSISDVIHRAFIEVDEAGTEAAAATAVVVVTRSIAPQPKQVKQFRADRPFIFLLYDTEQKNILFFGKLQRPE